MEATTTTTATPMFEHMCQRMRDRGEQVSAGSWEDAETVYVSSVRVVPNTCGHPAVAIQYGQHPARGGREE